MTPYVIAALLFCGAFCSFVAAGKNRNRWLWFVIGFVPFVGVIAVLVVPPLRPTGGAGQTAPEGRARKRPRRCSGAFIPDCRGCPYFERPLFTGRADEGGKCYCRFFRKELAPPDTAPEKLD